ncbi:RNA polymerase, sigma-24 subunit, ECF subfamily [Segniliparus rotundus DSM 44985]|uniref:RNA polymerase, sigma-24 subunit, ECF subfamily n=1 Tax=Segniliparus rotundus (strain ATCC BAA-972 / CDC 1076 / CIP 108378 / DSM 44985 / JCM 13578) TaxID=640132 RepID=D6Z9B7_SEGRD|nr:RNA polymerase sigma factor SigE [Segniliparus rotundus]ADG98547.1 RNA polymerase, sigma-24 subunit, ECF subfamily [Segniliparus rotundus DSM 44985]
MARSKQIAQAADNEVENEIGDVAAPPANAGLEGTARFDMTGQASDMPSWEALVREHGARVYRIAYRLTGNQQDAEDLTQETFLRVFRSLHAYRPGVFEGWLRRIATNLFLDQARRKTKIRMEALPEDYERVPSGAPSPEEVLVDADLDPALQSALDSLPPDFRAVVVLCDIEGLSYEEVATSLGVKLGTVRSRLHRARQAIRDSLLAQGGRRGSGDMARELALAAR